MSLIRSFVRRTTRRPIWQALGIYVVASWGVLQVVDTLSSALALPEWFPPMALALLIVGFPVVLATAFLGGGPGAPVVAGTRDEETRTAAVQADPEAPAGRVARLLTWRNAAIGGVLAMSLWGMAAAGWLILARGEPVPPPGPGVAQTVAVLPFDNLSADPDDAYLAGGLHGEILTQLSKIGDLHVLARGTMLHFEGETSPVQAGLELGARSVLEGTVQRIDDRLRVTVRLIDVATQRHLWAERYDRLMEDVFAVQTDIALMVADALRANLTAADTERIGRAPTTSTHAYEVYLRGREHLARGFGEAHLRNALTMFEQAVDLDPAFARAYAGLSEAALNLFWFGVDRTPARFEQGRAAAVAAYRLDPEDPLVLGAIGDVHYRSGEHDQALVYTERALERDPGNSDLHLRHAAIVRRAGGVEESLGSFARAVALDPLSAVKTTDLGVSYAMLRQYEEAERHLERAIALGPDQGNVPYQVLANVHLARGDPQAALAVLDRSPARDGPVIRAFASGFDLVMGEHERGLQRLAGLPSIVLDQNFIVPTDLHRGHLLSELGRTAEAATRYDSARVVLEGVVAERPEDHRMRAALAIAYAHLGRSDDAITQATRALEAVPVERDYITAFFRIMDLAHVLAQAGRHDEAVAQLERILEAHALTSARTLRSSPFLRPLHGHPRFEALTQGVRPPPHDDPGRRGTGSDG
jgi:TolB-like protein/Flp pilus assembly protein TadD